MEVIEAEIDGVKIIRPNIYRDNRGYFIESYSQKKFEYEICNNVFLQDK